MRHLELLAAYVGSAYPIQPPERWLCSVLDGLEARITEIESAQISARLDSDDEPLTITKLALAEAQQTIAHLEATCDLLTQQRDEARRLLAERQP